MPASILGEMQSAVGWFKLVPFFRRSLSLQLSCVTCMCIYAPTVLIASRMELGS